MNTLKLLQFMKLSNGLTVTIYDHSRVYFGDYYRVRLEILCTLNDNSTGTKHIDTEQDVTGKIIYKRYLEKMGVPSSEIFSVQRALLNDFEKNSLVYISSAEFPLRILESERTAKKTSGRVFLKAVS